MIVFYTDLSKHRCSLFNTIDLVLRKSFGKRGFFSISFIIRESDINHNVSCRHTLL